MVATFRYVPNELTLLDTTVALVYITAWVGKALFPDSSGMAIFADYGPASAGAIYFGFVFSATFRSHKPRSQPVAASQTCSVPVSAEKLLYLFLPKEQRDTVPGCLQEEFETVILRKFGLRYAKRWYWHQALISIEPIVTQRLARLRALGWLFEVIRRWGSQ